MVKNNAVSVFYLPEGFGIVKVLPSPRDLVLSMSPGKGMISVLSSSKVYMSRVKVLLFQVYEKLGLNREGSGSF